MITNRMWAGFFLFVCGWFVPYLSWKLAYPATGLEDWRLIDLGLRLAVFWVPFTFTSRRCSRPELPFWEGLCFICARLMSGCANITAVYLFPVLSVALMLALVHSVAGLFRGKEYTEQKWTGILRWFWKHGGAAWRQDPEMEQFAALLDPPQARD